MASYQTSRYYDSSDNKDCLFTYNETQTTTQEATTTQKKKIRVDWNITFNVYTHDTNNSVKGSYACSLTYNTPDKNGTSSRAYRTNGEVVVSGSFETDATYYDISLNGAIYSYSNNVSLSQRIYLSAGYTLGSAGYPTIVDNGDNTFTITGVVGQPGENNPIIDAYLNYRTDNQDCTWEKDTGIQRYLQLSTVAGSSGSITLNNKNGVIWPGDIGARALVMTKCEYNLAPSDNVRVTIKYYSAPTGEVTPITLAYSGKQPRLDQPLIFSWKSVTCDKYRIWLYVNNDIVVGYDPSDSDSEEAFVTTASYSVPRNIASTLNAGDVISFAVQPVNVDKKNNLYYGTWAQSSGYTLASAATVHVKVNGTWKSGTPFVKVNGVWKQASGVFVKSNGVWKQSV